MDKLSSDSKNILEYPKNQDSFEISVNFINSSKLKLQTSKSIEFLILVQYYTWQDGIYVACWQTDMFITPHHDLKVYFEEALYLWIQYKICGYKYKI